MGATGPGGWEPPTTAALPPAWTKGAGRKGEERKGAVVGTVVEGIWPKGGGGTEEGGTEEGGTEEGGTEEGGYTRLATRGMALWVGGRQGLGRLWGGILLFNVLMLF